MKTFCRDHDKSVLVKLGNTVAIKYINKEGGCKSSRSARNLNSLAQAFWTYADSLNLNVHAEHIPGVENFDADWLSRQLTDYSNWSLSDQVTDALQDKFGAISIDLFADRSNRKNPRFFSWRPDPDALAIDAFVQPWGDETLAYAFPPFVLIGRVITKVISDEANVLLIAPCWPGQSWCPALLELLVDYPRLLPDRRDLLTGPTGDYHPLIQNRRLHLMAWPLSGKSSLRKEFEARLARSSSALGARDLVNTLAAHGAFSAVGARNGRLIPFSPL
jgi:hypothetical protein